MKYKPFEFMFIGLPCRQGKQVTELTAPPGWTIAAAWPQPFGIAMILVKEDDDGL